MATLEDQNLPCNSDLSPIISLQLANITPAENCRGFQFHSGLDLRYLSSSLSWNILLSQPLSHHRFTLTCANWHRIGKGSSYRFIPPSCDLSSLRVGPGRIQKTGPGARTGKFSMRNALRSGRIAGVFPWLNLQTTLSTMRKAGKIDPAGWTVWGLGRNLTNPDPEWENWQKLPAL